MARELRRKWRLPGEAIPQRCARGQRAATRPRLREPPAACPCCREAPQLLLAGGSRRLFSVRAGDDLPLLSLLNTSCSGSSGSRGAAALSEGLNVLSKIWRLHERGNQLPCTPSNLRLTVRHLTQICPGRKSASWPVLVQVTA